MSWYADQVLPRVVNVLLDNKEFRVMRARVTAGLAGTVLEVGFGSGLNVPHLRPEVERLLAVDPATVGRKLAAKRIEASPVSVEFIGLDGQRLALDDDSVDHVLTTMTLCTIPDVDAALVEMLRVLKPGGTFHFLEHGRSPDVKVAHRQDRLNGLQRRIAGGCHLNRSIDTLITGAGLKMERLENFYLRGPKPMGYMYEGVAAKG